jgi:hypothetical protein
MRRTFLRFRTWNPAGRSALASAPAPAPWSLLHGTASCPGSVRRAAMPPHGHSAARANQQTRDDRPKARNIKRQKQEAERQHPETQDREDGESASDDQQACDRQAYLPKPAIKQRIDDPAGRWRHARYGIELAMQSGFVFSHQVLTMIRRLESGCRPTSDQRASTKMTGNPPAPGIRSGPMAKIRTCVKLPAEKW